MTVCGRYANRCAINEIIAPTATHDPERYLAILELGHSNGARLSYRFCQLTYASVPIASTLGISPTSTC
ncbi:hypothetical protein PSAB6_640043 [Paraburkholderia sabiae]|nr:hypothetical protein PSAB6_640043 [Paraburkholderia sabiae]